MSRWLILGVLGTALIAMVAYYTLGGGKVISTDGPVVDADVQALGRMIASENPRDSTTVQVAICWAAMNEAARRGKAVADLVMPGGVPSGQNTGGRYASTRNPATEDNLNLARAVLAGQYPDPTNGAVQFDSPAAQRAALERNVSGYTRGPEEVAQMRQSEGKVMVVLPGVDPDHMRFWRYA